MIIRRNRLEINIVVSIEVIKIEVLVETVNLRRNYINGKVKINCFILMLLNLEKIVIRQGM